MSASEPLSGSVARAMELRDQSGIELRGAWSAEDSELRPEDFGL